DGHHRPRQVIIGRPDPIDTANRTGHRVRHSTAYGLHFESVTLSASALDLDRNHDCSPNPLCPSFHLQRWRMNPWFAAWRRLSLEWNCDTLLSRLVWKAVVTLGK